MVKMLVGREAGECYFDQFGRTLTYVWVDGKLANEELLKVNLAHQAVLIQAANQVHDQRIGLWSECGGD